MDNSVLVIGNVIQCTSFNRVSCKTGVDKDININNNAENEIRFKG